ncbi:type VI secretion system Vgr family protein [Vogesella amnigena]|uniref:Type VI secretion system Vgr family protein n=1 Tax=Vogesella amnigena TaxID=1507449 RepID=A0ABV7TP03_9NEIS
MAIQAYHLSIPGVKGPGGLPLALSVRTLDITEAIGQPYRLTLTVTCRSPLDLLALLDRPARFTVSPVNEAALADGMPFAEATRAPVRAWAGVIRQATRLSSSVEESVYQLELAPRLARLADVTDSKLYQNLDIPALINQLLREDIGLAGQDFQIRTTHSYPLLEHITRWNETGLAFLQRCCEAAGLFYYFTQQDDHEVVVFADDQSHYLPAQQVALYRPDAGLESGQQEAVHSLRVTATPVTGNIQRLDYNYRTSGGADLRGSKLANPKQGGLIGSDYRWGTHQKDPQQGLEAARLQQEINLARQVVASGAANVLAFAPAQIFRTDGTPDPQAEFGWVITQVRHRAARNAAWLSEFSAIPAERIYRLPQTTPKPTISGTIPARITSPSRYTNAYLNEHGLYRVQYLFDQQARNGQWPPAGSSRLMRLARPYAGDTYGFHFPLIDGTEVQVAFQGGDIDRPYLLTSLHDQTKPDLVTNKNHTRNVIRTPSNNKIRLEDKDNQQHIKLSTEYGKTQLNLGHLVDAQRQPRGEGFELRSDHWGALRAGKGIFISAEAQEKALGKSLDMSQAEQRLQGAAQQMQQLNELAKTAQAELADLQTQNELLQQKIKALQESAILLSAPSGVAITAGGSVQHSTDGNLICTAKGHANYGVWKKFTVAAGQAISLFAHQAGIKLLANKGKVQVQAQNDALELTARQQLTITSTENKVVITAKDELLLSCGGAWIQLKDGQVHLGTPDNILCHAISLQKCPPQAKSAQLPNLPKSELSPQKLDFRLRLADSPGPDGHALANTPWKIVYGPEPQSMDVAAEHVLAEGISDAEGRIQLNKQQKALLSEKYCQHPMHTWLLYPGQSSRLNVEIEQENWTDEDKLQRALNASGVVADMPESQGGDALQPETGFAQDAFSTRAAQLYQALKR